MIMCVTEKERGGKTLSEEACLRPPLPEVLLIESEIIDLAIRIRLVNDAQLNAV